LGGKVWFFSGKKRWFEKKQPRQVTAKQALKCLLKHRYRSLEEYDQYVSLLEDLTGHPDVDGYLKNSDTSGLKPKIILRDLTYEAELYQTLIH
jgi:hypothetical protein